MDALALCRAASCASSPQVKPTNRSIRIQSCHSSPSLCSSRNGYNCRSLTSKQQCGSGFCLIRMLRSGITQQVDLGQCLLRASNSRLQLQLTAAAHFSQPASQSKAPPVRVSHWQDLSSIWVTEAPELDIRLFIRPGHCLGLAVAALVIGLGDKLCASPVCLKLDTLWVTLD